MAAVRHIQNSFNGGEISARMMGRTDTAVYQIALETCENYVPTVEGPIVKRPGTMYVCDAHATTTWLGTFKFNLTQHYVIEWAHEKVRLFTNGARIETSPGVAYEVATPYSGAQAPSICTEQSKDRLYLTIGAVPPGALKRTGATTFSHETLTLRNGPFADQNVDQGVAVVASGVTGSITLSASSSIFAAGHVGSAFYLEAIDFADVPAWEAGMKSVAIGDKVRSDGKIYIAETGGTTGSIQPTHSEGAAWDGQTKNDLLNDKGPYGVRWGYLSDRYGVVRITAFTSSTEVTGTVERRLPDRATATSSYRWAHSALSNAAGWPSLVKIWKGRMMLVKDLDLIGSVVGDYAGGQVNFQNKTSAGVLADDLSFRRVLDTPDLPHWIAGDRQLLIGTPSLVIAVKKVNSQAGLSGTNIEAEPQIFKGTQPVVPLQVGASTMFVQRGGRKLRETGYDFSSDRYLAKNLNVFARHIIAPGCIQMAYQDEPEELIFAVRGDGQMAVHPYSPEQETKGFARHVQGGGGKILSAVSIAAPDGQSDEIWMLVERGGMKRICKMAPWRDDGDSVKDAFYVDEGVTFNASAGQTAFTGVPHLANQAVAILANGSPIEGVTVNGAGAFNVPAEAVPNYPFKLTVGLPFTATCVMLRPEERVGGQTIQGAKVRTVRLVIRLLDTLGIRVGGKGGILDNLLDRLTSTPMGEPMPLVTGDSVKPVSGSWGETGKQATIVSLQPLPSTIICAMSELNVG